METKNAAAACGEKMAESVYEPFRKELEKGVSQIINDIDLIRSTRPSSEFKKVRQALGKNLNNPVLGQPADKRILEIRKWLEEIRTGIDAFIGNSEPKQLWQLRTRVALWIQKIDAEFKKRNNF